MGAKITRFGGACEGWVLQDANEEVYGGWKRRLRCRRGERSACNKMAKELSEPIFLFLHGIVNGCAGGVGLQQYSRCPAVAREAAKTASAVASRRSLLGVGPAVCRAVCLGARAQGRLAPRWQFIFENGPSTIAGWFSWADVSSRKLRLSDFITSVTTTSSIRRSTC